MRLEFDKMKKIKDMSKNEKMKYMFNLLPKYWGEIDENAGIARLQKALYYTILQRILKNIFGKTQLRLTWKNKMNRQKN